MTHQSAVPIPPGTRDEIINRITPLSDAAYSSTRKDRDRYRITQVIQTTIGYDNQPATTYFAPQLESGGYTEPRTKYGHFHYENKLDNLVSFCPNMDRSFKEITELMERMKNR